MMQQSRNLQKRSFSHNGTLCDGASVRELAHSALARRLAAEGIVLLKNEELLPLHISMPVALLGNGASKTVKGGIGSGDVNNRENISIYQGLREAGISLVSEGWLKDYDERYAIAREEWKEKILEDAKSVENPFDAYAANPFVLPEGRVVTEEDIEGAKAAIYVISRVSGEGKDRRLTAGDYYLSARERDDILTIDQKKIPIVLILNAGGPIELTDILKEAGNIKAVLSISQPGQEGGRAVADVLLGKTAPAGKLTATWAKRYEDYPYAKSYSHLNGNLEREEYQEGIYVGYRYFDSFRVQPLYPFGYGLSYTSFEMTFENLKVRENNVEMDILVRNTGEKYAAKEVVQVYAALPQNGEEREYHRLVGFAKTKLLEPREAQIVTVTIEQKQFAGFSEQKQAWYMEAGLHELWIGSHSAALKIAAVLYVPKQVIIERTHAVCPVQTEYAELSISQADRAKWSGLSEKQEVPRYLFEPKEWNETFVYAFDAEKKRKTEATISSVSELPIRKLIPLLYGNITQGTSTLGSAGVRVPGSAGETTEALEEEYGIPSLIMADGPAGLRLRQSYEVDKKSDSVYGVGVLGSLENGFLEPTGHHEDADTYYQYCTAFPVGTALAQTWDRELMKEFGAAIAAEMEELHIDLWLAPGMNIQRNPLCGRNFEYYSEDPLLSGAMAAAVTAGVQSRKGCGVTIKHFACNNQEDNRMGVDVRISEKALREIYLRGFEIAVKESAPMAVMSAYNRINGVHAANSRDLCTVVLRDEWGFDGVVMSDWNTTIPEDGSIPWKCAVAGNDIIMPGNFKDREAICEAYEQGRLSEEEIRNCAGHIMALMRKLNK
ncbi:glycoside hydrolase family 3 N-terminal domain-containing protein [Roseburia hominis]